MGIDDGLKDEETKIFPVVKKPCDIKRKYFDNMYSKSPKTLKAKDFCPTSDFCPGIDWDCPYFLELNEE